MQKPSIVFFGSGPVAAESLSLLKEAFVIEAVITKPSTRSQLAMSAPKAPLFTVSSKSELDELISTENFTSTVGVLIDFGIIVSPKTISSFPKGIVNSHFSLLPEWRGADPISFSLLSGQDQTGVSLMLLVEAMDEGPLLAQSIYDLNDTITGSELTKDLIELSYVSLSSILPLWLEGSIDAAPQESVTLAPSTTPSYSRKLTREDGVISWDKPAAELQREIRAFDIWPKSKTKLGSVDVVITASKVSDKQIGKPGVIYIEDKRLYVACGEKSLEILNLKPVGKKEMPASAFLAGYQSRIS